MQIGSKVTYRRKDGLFSNLLQFSGVVVERRNVKLAPGVTAERFCVVGNHGEVVWARREELAERMGK